MTPMASTRTLHCARLFDGRALRDNVRLHLGGDRIEALDIGVRPDGQEPAVGREWLVAPGLIDIQVNGGGGLMFNDQPDVAGAAHIAHAHALQGSTGLMLTLITDTREHITRAQRAVQAALSMKTPGVMGLHMEGPFLNVARKGIHQAQHITPLSPLDVDALIAGATGVPTLVTLAPECVPHGLIHRLSQAGLRVFAGHTEATAADMARAMAEEGLCGVTHLFNAMSQIGPRDAGVVGTALLHPALWAGIILDGHHVGEASFELAWRARGRARLMLVSDAMATAGTTQDQFNLQGQAIHVREGRCENADGTLAGAAICLADAVRLAVTRYQMRLTDALYCATASPAELLGLAHDRGHVAPGARADFAIFDKKLFVQGVMQGGQWLRHVPHHHAEACDHV
jgi:N-acetylglucosamine-6-phosphate deacetylase